MLHHLAREAQIPAVERLQAGELGQIAGHRAHRLALAQAGLQVVQPLGPALGEAGRQRAPVGRRFTSATPLGKAHGAGRTFQNRCLTSHRPVPGQAAGRDRRAVVGKVVERDDRVTVLRTMVHRSTVNILEMRRGWLVACGLETRLRHRRRRVQWLRHLNLDHFIAAALSIVMLVLNVLGIIIVVENGWLGGGGGRVEAGGAGGGGRQVDPGLGRALGEPGGSGPGSSRS